MARPTDYSKETIEKTKYYLENYVGFGDVIPSIAGLSVVLGVARQTIYDWASQESKKEFSDILQSILSTQEKTLINKGLTGEFNSNIAKLALGKHGYSDRQELMGKDGEKLFPDREKEEKANEAIRKYIGDTTRE